MNLRIKANRAALDEAIFNIVLEASKKTPIAMIQIEGEIVQIEGQSEGKIVHDFDGVHQINIRTACNRLHAAGLINKIGKGPSTRYYRGRKKALPKGWGE